MAIFENLTEEEMYLVAILQDESGLDLAEFTWSDSSRDDNIWRAWPFQVPWFRCTDEMQIDACARSVGKSQSVAVRAFAFPFIHPGQEMVITAPEKVHLDAITDKIETQLVSTRLSREMLTGGRATIKHQPFHCVAEGQQVLTRRGHIAIEDVVPGDFVLTHESRWREVQAVLDQGVRDVVEVSGRGHFGLRLTPDHQLYTRTGRWSPRTRGKKLKKIFTEPGWTAPQDWTHGDPKQVNLDPHWASPAFIPEGAPLPAPFRLSKQGGALTGTRLNVQDEKFLWALGLYVAEGCTWNGKLTVITVHEDEATEVSQRFTDLGITHSVRSQTIPGRATKAVDIRITNSVLASWLETEFPGLSHEKKLPSWVWSLTTEGRQALFDGYAYGDGHFTERNTVRLVTTSRPLAADMKLLAQTLCYTAGFYSRKPQSTTINGRTVDCKQSYEVQVDLKPWARAHRHDQTIDQFTWSKTSTPGTVSQARTYDLVVDEDHSFIVEGIVVHNCNFSNGSRIMGRIPQRDGKGIKGSCKLGTLTLTRDRGLVPIEDVEVGDHVWSHERRWTPVIDTYTVEAEGYRVKGQGAFDVDVSADHRFYARNDESKSPGKMKRDLGAFTWEWPDNFSSSKYCPVNVYWTGCTDFGDPLPIPPVDYTGCKTRFSMDEHFFWVVGRYLADGTISRGHISLFVHQKDQAELKSRLKSAGMEWRRLKREHSTADRFNVYNSAFTRWIDAEFNHHSHHKEIPTWCFTMPAEWRQALLDGYLSGDGASHTHNGQHRDTVGSASKKLALGLGTLATTLDYNVGYSVAAIGVTEVMGTQLKEKAADSYRCRLTKSGQGAWDQEGFVSYKIKTATLLPKQTFYGIVTDDHSYWAEGVLHHNTHPIWLEMDEAQDYPRPGWMEITNTLNRGFKGACWRAHGVTRGVRDEFYKHTSPGSGWTVHNYVAMNRPTWTDAEREDLIQKYSSKNSPDYRRNVLGMHGDQTNPLFVLSRLMRTVDMEPASDYNQWEYHSVRLTDEMLDDNNMDIIGLVDLPGNHKNSKYIAHWIGMDVGFTSDPSEILVFGEEKSKKQASGEPESKIRLLTRIHLERVKAPAQAELMIHLMRFYKPTVFAMDSTGLGLPLFDVVQNEAPDLASRIKGYNFSGKILVGFDDSVDVDEWTGDRDKDAEIKRNVKEYAQDCLRTIVDQKRIILPFDKDLIAQFEGGTEQAVPSRDQYGRRRIFSVGDDHALDAARMAALGWKQYPIEEMTKKEKSTPVLDTFMTW